MPGQPSADRPACRETTKAGTPCRNKAAAGSQYCGPHGGGQRRVGAPSKLDEALVNSLVEVVERGVTWDIAAQAAGIHKSTLIGWRERGATDLAEGRPTLYADLVDRLSRAGAQAEVNHVANIAAAAAVDWRASAFWLERRAAARFGRKDHVDVDVHERAAPRTVTPQEPDKRAVILDLLRTATAPPTGIEAPTEGRTP